MSSDRAADVEAQAQLARVRALAEAAALPLDEERLAALARRLPGPSPLDRYDFGETEPPLGLRLADERGARADERGAEGHAG